MQNFSRSFISMLVAGAVSGSAALGEQEQKIQRSHLPQAVAIAFDRESKGAEIRNYRTDKEHGKRVYEAETILNGHSRDIQVAEDGTLNEVEEEVELSSLSNVVKEAITKKAQGAKIIKIESLTKAGKLVAYEASLFKGLKKSEIQVGPDGSKLAHSE